MYLVEYVGEDRRKVRLTYGKGWKNTPKAKLKMDRLVSVEEGGGSKPCI